MKILTREEAIEIYDGAYAEMLETEEHHNHEIVLVDDVIRWKENPNVRHLTDHTTAISLNDLIPLLYHLGFDKNSELHRHLYRCMGYSLSGYHELFYWDANNEDYADYVPDPDFYKKLTT